MRRITALLGAFLVVYVETAKLPSYFPICYQDDQKISECFINAANNLNQQVRNGIPEIGLRPLDPYVCPDFNMTIESPVSDFHVITNSFTLYRLYNYQFVEADVRPKDGVIGGRVILPDLSVWTNFKVEGHVINLSVAGGGELEMNNTVTTCDFLLSDWDVKGNCNGIKVDVTCKVHDLKLNLTGLVNGDVLIPILNMNSELIASEISPAYSQLFQEILRPFLIRLCRKYSIDELFPRTS
ncbi:uncharacterized protein LOC116161970 [Photinus pyralis]|uniref:uncharacterized protein LOC116161970 n=1 Tax=Photinus pyralis TaxID=7054 RepID=UPI001267320A|nr:uncharacterized protein LOC116161970 [Photinus pyralis]